MAKTSINIQPLKPGSEIHNTRRKELDYVRKDLTHLNESWTDPRYKGKSFSEIRQDIADRYKAHIGQKMQSKMVPLREGVVVIDNNTTMEQLQKLATAMEEKFGIKTIQIHIHRDEGHKGSEEWKPNLHAHMVFDWTQPNGKSLSLNKSHMSELQTLVADVLGMERGVSSDVKHLNAVQYKNKKETERSFALQQQNSQLQEQIAQYQQDNEQLHSENEELLKKAEDIRKTVADLQREVKKMKITKKGKQALLIGLNKVTDIFGKSDLLQKKEHLEAKVEEAEEELDIWKGKVAKLSADLDRRAKERDAAYKENYILKQELLRRDGKINRQQTDLQKVKKENLHLGRIAEPWNHTLPDVVNVKGCDIIGVPGGHTLRVDIEGHKRLEFYRLTDKDYQSYCNGDISIEHLIGKYAVHDIDVAVGKRLRRMSQTGQKQELSKLINTMFHALPAILYPSLAAHVAVSHGPNGYVGIRHKSRDEILRDMIDQGYTIHR